VPRPLVALDAQGGRVVKGSHLVAVGRI